MPNRPSWFELIKDVPNYPKPGIVFKDITPLLANASGFRAVVEDFAAVIAPLKPTQIIGIEARGFIFGAALARELDVGFTLVRKPGKLPRETRSVSYDLEYGSDSLEIHVDALTATDRAVIVDDVLATGGTAAAVVELVRSTGAEIGALSFLMELGFLNGRAKLPADVRVESLITL